MCELGCGTGASLKLWKNYFECGKVVGVDISESAKKFEEDRIQVYVGNVPDEEIIAQLKNNFNKFSIILDDASHAWGNMRVAFENLWDMLEDGGIYVLEDTDAGSFGAYPEFPPNICDSQPIMQYVLDRAKNMEICSDYAPEYYAYYSKLLPQKIQRIEREMDEVMIINGSCLIKKRKK